MKKKKPSDLQFEKPSIQYLFIEGETSQIMARRFAGKFFEQFQFLTSNWKLPEVQSFSKKHMKIYRALNSNQADDNEIYITGFKVGEVSPQSLASYSVLTKYINNEAFQYLRNELHLGYVVNAFMKIVGNQIVISLFVMGSKAVGFEKAVEKFLNQLDDKIKNLNFQEVEDMKESIKADYESPFTE